MHNYFLIEHNYSHYVIYNFKPDLKIWKNYSVVKIIILLILISRIIILFLLLLFKNSMINHLYTNGQGECNSILHCFNILFDYAF